jgi:hypothetical protein
MNHVCPYDQAKAKALLGEAGYGPSRPLTLELMTNTEKSVFSVIATVIKEQYARLGVTANIKLVDKVSWMNTTLQDGPWDMYVEDLLSLLTIDSRPPSTARTCRRARRRGATRATPTRSGQPLRAYAREIDATQAQYRRGHAGVRRRQDVLERDLGCRSTWSRSVVKGTRTTPSSRCTGTPSGWTGN